MYSQTAKYYDKFYAFKDYPTETLRLTYFIAENLRSSGNRILDVACGTGMHLFYLKEHFEVEGLDIEPELLEIARQRNPDVLFHLGDMTDFSLAERFDVVTCLFSSIGYVRTLENLDRAIRNMARHVVPGGLLIIEPWFTPGDWHPGTVHAIFINEPELKLARVNTSYTDGSLSTFDFHYLIGTPEKTEHLIEHHDMGLFEQSEMLATLSASGLDTLYEPMGLTGRGLYIARTPS